MSDQYPDDDPFALDEAQMEALLGASPAVIIANHAFNLLQLATIHLAATPPNLAEASLVIDAVGGLLAGVQGRLTEGEELLVEALSQIRLAFVRASTHGND